MKSSILHIASSIRSKVIIISALTLLTVFSVLSYQTNRWITRHFEAHYKQMAIKTELHVIDILELLMLSKNLLSIQSELNEVKTDEGLTELRIFNLSAEEVFSIGKGIREPLIDNVLKTKRPLHISRDVNGMHTFMSIYPIENKPSCHGCHGKEERLRGALLVSHSMEETAKSISHLRTINILLFLVLSLIAALVAIISAERLFFSPLKAIQKGTEDIEEGQFGRQIPVRSMDEIGRLTERFNHMSTTLNMLFAEKVRRLQELDVLNRIAGTAGRSILLDDMLQDVLEDILKLKPLSLENKGAIFLFNRHTQHLELKVSQNFSDEHAEVCKTTFIGECLCGIAAQTGEIILSEDSFEDKRHSRTYPDMKNHGHIILPLKVEEGVLGVLCLYLLSGIKPSSKEVELFRAIADIISVAVQNSLHHEELMMHVKELTALADASNVISAVTAPENIYEAICNIAIRKFELKMVWLGVIEEGSYEVMPVSKCGFEDGYLSTIKITYDDSETGMGPTGMAIKTMSPQVMNDIERDHQYEPWRYEASKRGYRSSMAVPLISSESKVIGVINLYSDKPYFFTRERVRLFQVFANHAATAIENVRLIEGLEEKVKERTAELETARMDAESANKAKSDFLANMSHELRTPLNSIMGFSEMMILGMAGEMPEKQKEYIKDIHESGDHLLSLINDILDLSKVEAGMVELEYKEVDIGDIIEDSLVFFKEKSLKHNITITTEVEEGIGSLQADKRMIKQVLVNLLSNAVKFTPDGGSVSVSARRVRSSELGVRRESKEGQEFGVESSEKERAYAELQSINYEHKGSYFVEISVEDTGIGIKSEDLPKLFQPFQQLEDPYEKRFQGTGLGLSLCRNIVELHGGRIWVESEFGKWSRFSFIIPTRRPSQHMPEDM